MGGPWCFTASGHRPCQRVLHIVRLQVGVLCCVACIFVMSSAVIGLNATGIWRRFWGIPVSQHGALELGSASVFFLVLNDLLPAIMIP